MSVHIPIFKKDDKEFFIISPNHLGDTEDEAWKIGIGTQLIDGSMYQFKFTGRTEEVTDFQKVHMPGTLGKLSVGIISGLPELDGD